MELNIKLKIDVPNIDVPVEMTPAQLMKFHDDLTQFINDNYAALTNENTSD
jgi:hypothetical protein